MEDSGTSDYIYDYIIVGGGIAGLYTAYKLIKHNPNTKICILEAYNQIGGRIHTIKRDGVYFEAGASRFNNKHKRVLALIKELHLDKYITPITSDIQYIPINPKYDRQLETIFPTINSFILDMQHYIHKHNISSKDLINTTILEFAHKHYHKQYPTIKNYLSSIYQYYSELGVLNALEGIHLFTNEFSTKVNYFVLHNGLNQITNHIYSYLKKQSGVICKLNTMLEAIDKSAQSSYYDVMVSQNKVKRILKCKNIILALPKPALFKIKYLMNNPNVSRMLNSIENEELYRIYACYPKDKHTGKVWFANLHKISTNLPIKYIIPIDYEHGIIMISYLDALYSKIWNNKVKHNTFEKHLHTQLTLLFPDAHIPQAKWYEHCHWSMGAGYWKPTYNRKILLQKIITPLPKENIFICGENYSSHQAWIEGALETSDLVLDKIID